MQNLVISSQGNRKKPTGPEKEDVSPFGIRPRQDREETQVQNVFDRGWLQVLEDLRPGLTARVVVEQQLQGTVIVELPGPQEAQQEGVIQSGSEVGMFLVSQTEKIN